MLRSVSDPVSEHRNGISQDSRGQGCVTYYSLCEVRTGLHHLIRMLMKFIVRNKHLAQKKQYLYTSKVFFSLSVSFRKWYGRVYQGF